ncbi:MAG: hypothetical protein ACREJO_05270 [Phycisphaerales bacterium]
MSTPSGNGMIAMSVLAMALGAGALAALGPLDDPSSGPAGGTTNVRPAMSSPGELPPRIGRAPAFRGTKPIESSPLQSRPTNVPGVREVFVPGAQRWILAPGVPGETAPKPVSSDCLRCHTGDVRPHEPGSSQVVRRESLRDLVTPNSRTPGYYRSGGQSFLDRAHGVYVPGADRRAPGFHYFPDTNSVVARPLSLQDYIRYSGLGPYWSDRVNNGADRNPPVLHLNNDGSVSVTFAPTNWFAPGGNGFWDQWPAEVLWDPQYPPGNSGMTIYPIGATPTPAAPPSLLDQADDKFAARDYAAAAELYRQHLAVAPSDAWAMRAMGISLFLAKRMEEGTAATARAYATNPDLADEVIPAAAFPRGASQVRDAIGVATINAERVRTDDAWLMVAVLLQSSGQPKGALKMVDRAVAAGLDPIVADKFRAVLKP